MTYPPNDAAQPGDRDPLREPFGPPARSDAAGAPGPQPGAPPPPWQQTHQEWPPPPAGQQPAWQPYQGVPPYVVDPLARSRVLAGVLGILFGALGVHNFYTGYMQYAWIQLGSTLGSVVLTIITLGLFSPISSIVIPGMAVWGLVEGILFLTQRTGRYSMDATGRPLRD